MFCVGQKTTTCKSYTGIQTLICITLLVKVSVLLKKEKQEIKREDLKV